VVCGGGYDEGEAVDELKNVTSSSQLAISDTNSNSKSTSQRGHMRTFPIVNLSRAL